MSQGTNRTILITGVSSGIGHALCNYYLQDGSRVLGMSRRTPEDLVTHPGFTFGRVDLNDAAGIDAALEKLLSGTQSLSLVVLNAGVLGQFGDLAAAEHADLVQTMQVNVWANTTLLNGIFGRGIAIQQVVAISSGAAVNGHRGGSGYSISKAALNMLVQLYALEQPTTHFCALAPGLVDTAMQDQLCGRAPDDRYAAVEFLRSKRNTPDMPTPAIAAPRLAATIEQLPSLVTSGDYADVRQISLS